jgi:dipeptidyl aminopeptidase/acylaminoacyl peptidase
MADHFLSPLLLVHGVNDVRVNKNQSDLMFSALKKYHKPVTYIVLPEGGHMLLTSRYSSYLTAAEDFLSQQLGGYSEPAQDWSDKWDDLVQ